MTENQYVTVCAADTGCLYALSKLGREIADRMGCALRVMLFAKGRYQCEENARFLEYVFECARRMDAEMKVFYTDHPIEKLKKDKSEYLVMNAGERLTEQIRCTLPDKKLMLME